MTENNDREALYEEYYNEMHKSANYKRNGRLNETNAFQRWLKIRNNVNILTGNTQTDNSEKIRKDDDEIIITPNKILLLHDYKLSTIFNSKIEVLNTIIDERKNEILYSFKIKNLIYPSYRLNEFIKELGNNILGGIKGKDVISYLTTEKAKKLPERKGKYVPGWDNGWWLPINEKKKKFGIICYSEEQRSAYNNLKKCYKKYNIEEKKKLKNKIQQFVKITDMPEAYKTIIIACCIINPFRLYFIDTISIFPHLNLSGATTAGKTYMLDAWSTNFYKNRLTHMSGKTALSTTRIEGALTASTFPTMVDDYKETTSYNTAQMEMILKDGATGRPLWKRLHKDGINYRARELISSMLNTSQSLGELMSDSALLARTISLPFKEPIESNPIWIKYYLELKKEKPFSLMYDVTKSWTNKHLDRLMQKVDKIYYRNLEFINPKIADKNYPKLLKIYKIILAGCLLAKGIYGINLKVNDVWDVLVKARRTSIDEFLNIFLSYCEFARHLDSEKPIPRYLTFPLNYNPKKRVYVFTMANLRDFITHYAGYSNKRIKFKLNSLFEKIKDSLEYKKLVKLDHIWHYGKTIRAIWINPILIMVGDVEPTEQAKKIAHRFVLNVTNEKQKKNKAMGEEIEIPDHQATEEEIKKFDKKMEQIKVEDSIYSKSEEYKEFMDLD